MDKQKAIQIINSAPVGWAYYSELRNRFFIRHKDNDITDWYRMNEGKWKECIPLHETIESMMPKSEILKITLEGEEMKNAGDNLILGCEDSKCDEWPCVGDEVKTRFGEGIIKLPKDVKGCYVISIKGNYHQLKRDEFINKKTPEEELRDDIVQLIDDADGLSSHALALSLMDKFNIKPQ